MKCILCAFSKSFTIKNFSLSFKREKFKFLENTKFGRKLNSSQTAEFLRPKYRQDFYTAFSYKTKTKHPPTPSAKWHPLITQLLYSLPAAWPSATCLSLKYQKPNKLSWNQHIPLWKPSHRGVTWTALWVPDGFSNILAKNSSQGGTQAHHADHVKKIPYIFHGQPKEIGQSTGESVLETGRNPPKNKELFLGLLQGKMCASDLPVKEDH